MAVLIETPLNVTEVGWAVLFWATYATTISVAEVVVILTVMLVVPAGVNVEEVASSAIAMLKPFLQ